MSFRPIELYTFIGSKSRPTWLLAVIEVSSPGLVSKLFIWRDIFTARDLSPRLVALVRVSVTVEPTESDTAAPPTFSSPLAQRKAA